VTPYSGVDTTRLLVGAMKVAQMNHRLIANNIANADTPGYTPVTLDFQATLRDAIEGRGRIALRRTSPEHLAAERLLGGPAALVYGSKNDYNQVDIDQEMANLSRNTGDFNVYGSLLVKRFQMAKNMLANLR
jgi:flagellar basal-body rod protein FlgB